MKYFQYNPFYKVFLVSLLIIFKINTVSANNNYTIEKIDGITKTNTNSTYNLILNTPDLLIIDSRKPTVYLKGHIQGAVNIQDTLMTEAVLFKYAKNKTNPILFYCNGKSCSRSANAAKKALAWNYNNIYWFRNGWNEWINKDMPIEK